jgi:metal-responsive CopG/Arc/MetJ family transcriptional regulator
MRFEVTIPDEIYRQAQRVAEDSGVNFDRFISEAVELHLEDEETVTLTEEQYAAIDAVAPYEPGQQNYTREEVAARARKRTDAWLQAAEITTVLA